MNRSLCGALAKCALVLVIVASSNTLLAGPNRNSTVNSTPSGAANLNPDGSAGRELSEGGGYSTGNYCRVRIGPEKQTWVMGEGKIVIIPTTVQYTRTYELYGWDRIDRVGQITGCEFCVWFSSAFCWTRVTAEAGKHIMDPEDIAAVCSAELRYWEWGLLWGADVRECTVTNSTVDRDDLEALDSEGVSWPSGTSVTRAIVQINGGTYKGVASQICLVSVPLHPGPWVPILPLAYKEYARLYMNVQAPHGHAKVDVVHEEVPDPASGGNTWNYWKVNMQAWDFDDPQLPVCFRDYAYDGKTNQ